MKDERLLAYSVGSAITSLSAVFLLIAVRFAPSRQTSMLLASFLLVALFFSLRILASKSKNDFFRKQIYGMLNFVLVLALILFLGFIYRITVQVY